MGGVVYYRAKNQVVGWGRKCNIACDHVTAVMANDTTGKFKGRRKEMYNKAVLYGVVQPEDDFVHSLELTKSVHDYRQFAVISRNDASEWVISNDPALGYTVNPTKSITQVAFPVLGHLSFPVAVVLYIMAQTLKVLRGYSLGPVVAVLVIVVSWLFDMLRHLIPIYQKLRD